MNDHIAEQHPLLKSTTAWVIAPRVTCGDNYFFLTVTRSGKMGYSLPNQKAATRSLRDHRKSLQSFGCNGF